MSLIDDNELTLPGVLTEVKAEYSLGFDDSQFGTTDGVIVIGTAFSGPVGKLVPISNVEQARYVFGNAYDSSTKKEASLTANLQAVFEGGCRTLYGVRISGKDLAKDFKFKVDNNLRLRISSAFPSNEIKDCFAQFDDTVGAETLRLFKPASKATIAEKMAGLVEADTAVMVTELKLNQDYDINANKRLVDLISLFNGHAFNNVLRLSIIDEDGVDVTNTPEAYNIPVGVMFPGVYFVGRDRSVCATVTDIGVQLATEAKPYDAFNGLYSFKLNLNTDVCQPYPIFAQDATMADFRNYLKAVEITTVDRDAIDYLKTAGVPDRAFAKDSVDYEETDLSTFDIYKRLGSGFAVTAKAERRVDGIGKEIRPRVKEASQGDPNRIAALIDGIYSMIENAKIRYRVLACANADDVIESKLPTAEDFLVTAAESIAILGGKVVATAKVAKDNAYDAKAYTFKFETLTDAAIDSQADIYTAKIMKSIPSVASVTDLANRKLEPGKLVMVVDGVGGAGTLKRANMAGGFDTMEGAGLVGNLFIVDNNIYVGTLSGDKTVFQKAAVTAGVAGKGTYESKEYVLGENNDNVYVYEVLDGVVAAETNPLGAQLAPLGDFNTMISGNDDNTLVFATNNDIDVNNVLVKSVLFAGTGITLSELVDFLNAHETLSRLFSFELAPGVGEIKDDFIADIADIGLGTEVALAADRKVSCDYSKYIPYKTTDSFARQLAQHATYTDLKTCPAHGVIGLARMKDTSLTNIAKRVDNCIASSFDLYAKTTTGRNMLDKNNLPYGIGKSLTITAFQSKVDVYNYTFIANGAASYAGMVSNLPIHQSSTGQAIAVVPDFEYTNYQLGRMTTKGFITLHDTLSGSYVVTDGTTMDDASSPFKRFSSVRIMAAVEELIRDACEPFIGKQNNAANRNSLQTAIKSNLEKVKDTLILSYSFSVIYTKQLAKLNIVDIDYDVIPTHEIRNIRNRITVKE